MKVYLSVDLKICDTNMRLVLSGGVVFLLSVFAINSNLRAQQNEEWLVIGNTASENILAYDLNNGSFVKELVPRGAAGMQVPDQLWMGNENLLYISSGRNEPGDGQGILRLDIGGEIPPLPHVIFSGLIRPYGFYMDKEGGGCLCSFRTDEIYCWNPNGPFELWKSGHGKPGDLNGPNAITKLDDYSYLVTTQGSIALQNGTGDIEFSFPSQLLLVRNDTIIPIFTGSNEPAGFTSLLGIAPVPDKDCFLVSDFAGSLLQFSRSGELVRKKRLGSNKYSRLGYPTYYQGLIYVAAFDDKTEDGAIFRFSWEDWEADGPLDAVPWIDDPVRLRRPIGIAVTTKVSK